MNKQKSWVLKISLFVILFIILIPFGYYLFALTPVGPLPEALPFLNDSQDVQVISTEYLFFQPQHNSAATGLILYPGGRVDYRSYGPLAHLLAEEGWPVAVIPMPLNLAVLGPDKANEVISEHPEISNWVIGGHSLGGSMAAQFASKNPAKIQGIVFLAAYPVEDELLTNPKPVLSVFASEDGLIPSTDWGTYSPRFPANTRWVEIQGGNHAGFGWYGAQSGDKPAKISLTDQLEFMLQAINQYMNEIDQISTK